MTKNTGKIDKDGLSDVIIDIVDNPPSDSDGESPTVEGSSGEDIELGLEKDKQTIIRIIVPEQKKIISY